VTDAALVVPSRAVGLDGLADVLDRLLGSGVAVAGDIVVSVGGVDLVRVDLRALVASVTVSAGAR
jgi:hypothetical protein